MLPKKIDRTKTYHKVTNLNECHHGLQYKTGLNIDPVPFNNDPEVSCCKGGIYFTTPKYACKFLWIGCWIREITIPEDARVVLDSSGDKYRTNKIILGEKHNFGWYFNNLFINKWFDKETFSTAYYWGLAVHCSKYFNEWFDKKTFPKKYYWSLNEHCQKYKHIWYGGEQA